MGSCKDKGESRFLLLLLLCVCVSLCVYYNIYVCMCMYVCMYVCIHMYNKNSNFLNFFSVYVRI